MLQNITDQLLEKGLIIISGPMTGWCSIMSYKKLANNFCVAFFSIFCIYMVSKTIFFSFIVLLLLLFVTGLTGMHFQVNMKIKNSLPRQDQCLIYQEESDIISFP